MLHSMMDHSRLHIGHKAKQSRPQARINNVKSSHALNEVQEQSEKETPIIRLNIGGKPYSFLKSQLSTVPGTMLSKFATDSHQKRIKSCHAYLPATNEYFWARSPHLFQPIADFYFENSDSDGVLSTKLYTSSQICRQRFDVELKFWDIPQKLVANCSCCSCSGSTSKRGIVDSPKKMSVVGRRSEVKCRRLSTPHGFKYAPDIDGANHHQHLLTNDPRVYERSEKLASNCYNKPPIAALEEKENEEEMDTEKGSFESLAQLEYYCEGAEAICKSKRTEKERLKAAVWRMTEYPEVSWLAKLWALLSITFVVVSVSCLIMASMRTFQDDYGDPLHSLRVAEWVCIAWFIFELLVRFTASPHRLRFFKSFLNIVDFLSILPFFFEVALEIFGDGQSKNVVKLQGAIVLLRILKVLRVSRIFKLARYSSGMQNFGLVLKESISELGILCLSLITAVIFFSTLMYFLEKDTMHSPFQSIPAACWWAVITMTTVGYGDVVPVTVGGKVLASITSISGVLVLAFPVTTIVSNFHKFQQRQELLAKAKLGLGHNDHHDQQSTYTTRTRSIDHV